MGKIEILDEGLTNLIAAGEVVERIASVVKELTENAIDAGATKIKIQLTDAGLSEIRVSDNGSGMDTRDAKMAVIPHATSKIKSKDDLFSIRTLGFRGEALASIASVSNFKIITSVDGYHGIMVSFRGGLLISEATLSRAKGTDIIVKNLFYNTPVRLESLQSQSVELGYTIDYVSKMALTRPNISFELTNNNRILVSTYGNNDVLETIYSIYGPNVAKNMISIFDDNGLYKVEGFISKIEETRSTKNNIVLSINGRVIRNNSIINSIVAGYGNKLMTGRYPIALVNIKVDASMVDVNVHPSKLEVRFSNEDKLKEMITGIVAKTLEYTDLTVNARGKDEDFYSKYREKEEVFEESPNSIANTIDSLKIFKDPEPIKEETVDEDNYDTSLDSEMDDNNEFIDNDNQNLERQDIDKQNLDRQDIDKQNLDIQDIDEDVPFTYDDIFEEDENEDEEIKDLLESDRELNKINDEDYNQINLNSLDNETIESLYLNEDISKFETVKPISDYNDGQNRLKSVDFDAKEAENALLDKINFEKTNYEQLNLDKELKISANDENSVGTAQNLPNLNYIGQLFGTYILASDAKYFYMIDQHAAMERINYEKIKKELMKNNTLSYDLLVPFSIEFSPKECFFIKESLSLIENLGIKIEEFGNNSFIVRSIPTWIFRGKEKEFVEEIISKIITASINRDFNKAYFLDNIAKSLACKKSIKGNEYHSDLEISYLLEQLSVTDNPYTCPHGRPVIIKLSNEEIEKWFKRIV